MPPGVHDRLFTARGRHQSGRVRRDSRAEQADRNQKCSFLARLSRSLPATPFVFACLFRYRTLFGNFAGLAGGVTATDSFFGSRVFVFRRDDLLDPWHRVVFYDHDAKSDRA